MNYLDARKSIELHNANGVVLGLDAIQDILLRMGNFHDSLRVVHIAGTNGKGSVGTFLAYILANSGYKVGRYISPAVFEYNEIIQYSYVDSNGSYVVDYISDDEIATYVSTIIDVERDYCFESGKKLTTYELETVMALMAFAKSNCDIVLLEVGMGGRLDATNVIDNPVCEVITSISRDHMRYLGDTLEQITLEKCGIIKDNSIAVISRQQSGVLEVIKRYISNKNAKIVTYRQEDVSNVVLDINGTQFDFLENCYTIKMLGGHQIDNAVTAINTAKVLINKGFAITQRAIKTGLENAIWHGRLEIVSKKPLVLTDGAHNVDAAYRLRDALNTYFEGYKILLVTGMFEDKETQKIMEIIAPKAECVYTFETDNPRKISSKVLASQAKMYCTKTYARSSIINALNSACRFAEEATENDNIVVVCFGSLSFQKDVYKYFNIYEA